MVSVPAMSRWLAPRAHELEASIHTTSMPLRRCETNASEEGKIGDEMHLIREDGKTKE